MALVPTVGWNETTPPGSETESLGDNQIRTFKQQVREVGDKEHDWPSSGQATGRHQFPQVLESGLGAISDLTDGMIAITTDTKSIFNRQSGVWEFVGSHPMMKGTRANQPAAGRDGRLYWVFDEGLIERDNGTVWELIAFVDNPIAGKSVVYHDHFQQDHILIRGSGGSSEALSSMWNLSYFGDADNMTDGWKHQDPIVENGVIEGFSGGNAVMIETLAGVTLAAKNPVVVNGFRIEGLGVTYAMRWGLADTWVVDGDVDPARGIFVRRRYDLGVHDTWEGVVEESTGETAISLGTSDSNWHVLKIVVNAGTVEFFMDGASKGTIGGVSITEVLRWGATLIGEADDQLHWDFVTILSDEIGYP